MTTQELTDTAAYRQQLYDPRWRSLRDEILQRDGYRCRSCGSPHGLQVHHRQYHVWRKTGAWKKPWEYSPRLLVSLCDRCHESGHKQYQVPIISI